ncbi:hypothetical protein ACLOJK_014230 [Asimina triloba]
MIVVVRMSYLGLVGWRKEILFLFLYLDQKVVRMSYLGLVGWRKEILFLFLYLDQVTHKLEMK